MTWKQNCLDMAFFTWCARAVIFFNFKELCSIFYPLKKLRAAGSQIINYDVGSMEMELQECNWILESEFKNLFSLLKARANWQDQIQDSTFKPLLNSY